MKIIENQLGDKIPYKIAGNVITFNDEISINLAARERDEAMHIDICRDIYGGLVIGTGEHARWYVAQIDIPAREYLLTESEPIAAIEDEESGGMSAMESRNTREAVSFDMEKCTLTLWNI